MRTRGNRGQVALEFISTYGFAFFILLTTVGTLSYFGVFNISSLRNNECFFPDGIECVEFILNPTDPVPLGPYFPPEAPAPSQDPGSPGDPFLRVRVANTFGVNLTFVNITMTMRELGTMVTQCSVSQNPLPSPSGVRAAWPANWNATIWCPIPLVSYHPTQRYTGVLTLNFTQEGGSYQHIVKGTVSVTAQN